MSAFDINTNSCRAQAVTLYVYPKCVSIYLCEVWLVLIFQYCLIKQGKLLISHSLRQEVQHTMWTQTCPIYVINILSSKKYPVIFIQK